MEKTAAKRHQEKTHTEISAIILALKCLEYIEATTLQHYAVSTFFAVPAVSDQRFFSRNRTPKDLAKRSDRAPAGSDRLWVPLGVGWGT